MTEESTHPTREELSAYSLGQLAQERAVAIDGHISECQPCCETIVGLSSEDTFVALLQEAKQLPADQTVDLGGAPATPASMLPEVPAPLAEHPRYEIVGLVGKGGMGDVYKARHRMMDRTVALKIIKRELMQNSQAVDRFHREVKSAAKLSHPNIVTSHDAEQVGDVHFMVMEYVDGFDLSHIVKDRGALPIAEACDYVRQAAIGLQHAHEQGMVHRDIKPHNLMVTDVEARPTIKILDFGLASLAPVTSADADTVESRGDLTAAGAIMGTPDFIAPEQADDARQADIRSDIYSLGTTFYFLLSGRPPFVEGSVMHKLTSHAEVEPEPLESFRNDIPADLAAIVSKMIAKDPADRFQTPNEAVAALESFARARQDETPEQLPKPQAKPRRQRSRSLKLTAIATMFVAAIVAAVVYYIQTNNGTVRVEVIDPSLEVSINGRTITMKDGNKELEIGVGEHKLAIRVVGSDFKFETDSFEISRNGEINFKVDRLEGKVVVIKDRVRFKSEPLPNDVKSPTLKAETADEIVRRLSKIHGHLTAKLQTMLSEAAGIPNGQWSNFQGDPTGAAGAIKGEPLSLVLWKLNPLQESTKNLKVLEDFQYVGGVPKPKQLSDAMSPSRIHGYHSMLQPAYISGLTYDVKAGPLNSATLKGNFRYQAPNLYAGKIDFVIDVSADTDLQVTEFTLPNYGITIARGEDGMWKRGKSLGNDNKGTTSAKKIFATALVNGCEIIGTFTKEQAEITVKNPTRNAKDVSFYYQVIYQDSRERGDIFVIAGGRFESELPPGRSELKRVDILPDPNRGAPLGHVKDMLAIRVSRERLGYEDIPIVPGKTLDTAKRPVTIVSEPSGHSGAAKPLEKLQDRFGPEVPLRISPLKGKEKSDPKTTREDTAATQIKLLEQALDLYKLKNGTYPSTKEGLKALVEQPADENRAKNWSGYFLATEQLPLDPWGNAFSYEFPGTRGGDRSKPNIWSRGPDGKLNTDDDVNNWDNKPAQEVDSETEQAVRALIEAVDELDKVLNTVRDRSSVQAAATQIKRLSETVQERLRILTVQEPMPFELLEPNAQQCLQIKRCLKVIDGNAARFGSLKDQKVSKPVLAELGHIKDVVADNSTLRQSTIVAFFIRIKKGMTRTEVEEILGPSLVETRQPDHVEVAYIDQIERTSPLKGSPWGFGAIRVDYDAGNKVIDKTLNPDSVEDTDYEKATKTPTQEN